MPLSHLIALMIHAHRKRFTQINHLHAGHSAATRTDNHANRFRGPHGQNFSKTIAPGQPARMTLRPSASNPPEASCFNAPGSSCRHSAHTTLADLITRSSGTRHHPLHNVKQSPIPRKEGETHMNAQTLAGSVRSSTDTKPPSDPDQKPQGELVEPDGIEPTTS